MIGAYGLARADIGLLTKGKSDPFCEFIWNDDMIHKTKVIDDNLNPEWEDEKVLVGVNPDETPDSTGMVIAVWDSDGPLLKGDFLGQIRLSRETLLFPTEPGQYHTTSSLLTLILQRWY